MVEPQAQDKQAGGGLGAGQNIGAVMCLRVERLEELQLQVLGQSALQQGGR